MKASVRNRLLGRVIVAAYREIVPKLWKYSVDKVHRFLTYSRQCAVTTGLDKVHVNGGHRQREFRKICNFLPTRGRYRLEERKRCLWSRVCTEYNSWKGRGMSQISEISKLNNLKNLQTKLQIPDTLTAMQYIVSAKKISS